MGRKKGIPGYLLHKRTGNARTVINGREYSLGPFGSLESKRLYANLLAQHAAEPDAAPAVPDGDEMVVAELLSDYYSYAVERFPATSSTPERFRFSLEQIRRLHGETPVDKFGSRALREVRDAMISDGLSRLVINSRINCIRRAFKWAAESEIIPASLWHSLLAVGSLKEGETRAPEPKDVQPVPDEDVEQTLPFLPPTLADAVRVQRLTGCRPSEVLTMRPGDIERAPGVWRYRPRQHKTRYRGKDRIISIGEKAQDILLPYMLRPADAFIFSPREAEARRLAERHAKRKTPANQGNRRRPRNCPLAERYDKNSYRKAIIRAAKKAGVPLWTPNQLRHTAATEARKVQGLKGAQAMLGHSHMKTTEIYAEIDRTLADKVAREIG